MGKKARLGFRYLSLEDEMVLPTDKELTHAVEGVFRDRAARRRKAKLKWWHEKGKHKINPKRRAGACSIEKRYKAAKRRAIRRGWGWAFTQDEWERAWEEAGWVQVPGSATTQNPEGDIVPAFALRGSHAYKNTCMQRLDVDKPWSKDNYKIMFRGEALEDSKWYRKAPRD